MKQKIILAGSAITSQIVLDYLRLDDRYEVVGATVDDEFSAQGGMDGLNVVGLSEALSTFPSDNHRIIIAMGYHDLNRSRENMFKKLKSMGYGIETYIHPDARIYSRYPLGEGALIFPGAIIESHAQVGSNTLVWAGAVLAHHSRVGSHCWVAANAVISGQAEVKNNTFIGVNATVVNEVAVGKNNIIGANALISRNTKDDSVYLARSAEPFRCSSEEYIKYFGF